MARRAKAAKANKKDATQNVWTPAPCTSTLA